VRAPSSLVERRDVAARMRAALPCLAPLPLLIDGLDDAFLEAFAAWPVRIYLVRAGVLERIGSPHRAAVELPPFREWLLEAAAAAL